MRGSVIRDERCGCKAGRPGQYSVVLEVLRYDIILDKCISRKERCSADDIDDDVGRRQRVEAPINSGSELSGSKSAGLPSQEAGAR